METVDYLKHALQSCDGYVADHDYICRCRPVDVRRAIQEIQQLRALVEDLRLRLENANRGNETALAEAESEIQRLRAELAKEE